MPWDVGEKKFIRQIVLSPSFQGSNIWQQDQSAGIKVLDARHDAHDEDLAGGISRCLNIDGVNSMQAQLDAGAFKIVNLAKGTAITDAARVGQLIDDMTFDNGTRVLEISTADGDSLSVTIPDEAGGGAGGTVQSITIGDGLSASNNPITVSGSIALETIGVNQAFSGGISSITVDKHGRVTQVVTGGQTGATNLGINTGTTTVTVTSDTGTNAVIPAATTSKAGVISNTEKVKLNLFSASGNNAIFVGGITASGDISVDGITATGDLSVNGITATGNINVGAITANGNVNVTGAVTATGDITAFSDMALKRDIEPITDALLKLTRIDGMMFTRKDTGARMAGVIAQNIREVLPEAVTENEDGILSVSPMQLIGLIIAAVKELAERP